MSSKLPDDLIANLHIAFHPVPDEDKTYPETFRVRAMGKEALNGYLAAQNLLRSLETKSAILPSEKENQQRFVAAQTAVIHEKMANVLDSIQALSEHEGAWIRLSVDVKKAIGEIQDSKERGQAAQETETTGGFSQDLIERLTTTLKGLGTKEAVHAVDTLDIYLQWARVYPSLRSMQEKAILEHPADILQRKLIRGVEFKNALSSVTNTTPEAAAVITEALDILKARGPQRDRYGGGSAGSSAFHR